ncbi:MAG: OmpH family outer membrane protein [Candidatus Omnitrophica bacterium]|nr:OmpH family outer membrane protein [Candidatus Omnitrophota bacterium]
MKKTLWFVASMIFGLILLTGTAWAEKFAYVDIIKIASEYNKAKDYNTSLENKAKQFETELDKKANDFKQQQDKFSLLSDKEKDTKRQDLENKFKALEDFRRQKETDLRKEDFENSKVIADDIRNAIKQHAEKEGFTFVFDDRILIYNVKNLDITEKIIDTLNKGYVKKPAGR